MRISVLICLIILTSTVFSQDIIYIPDGSEIKAKITEVSPIEIKYKKYSNPEGPDYIIDKCNVLMVIYESGEYEIFLENISHKRIDPIAGDFGKNFIAYNIFDVMFGNVSISYERILKSGMVGFRIPFIAGIGENTNNNNSFVMSMIFGTGIDVNFYPTGQGRIKYFMGPSFFVASYYYKYRNNYYDPYYGYYTTMAERHQGMHYAIMVKHGLLYQPTKHFNVSIIGGLGLMENETKFNDNIEPKINFEFNIGYKF
ncbi:MAG: hypothetical protein ABII90_14115 [Bacteroidota bacterium]